MTLITLPPTMKAVVWTGPNKVEVKQIPTPQIVDPTDVIIRTTTSGICGSDLHIYRGHLPVPEGYPIGHEVVGEIVQVGSDVRKWRAGDRVIAPFSASCGDCFYCKKGETARCQKGAVDGGGQAEYSRLRFADAMLFAQPDNVPEASLVLLADILPTGYYCASSAKRMMVEAEGRFGDDLANPEKTKEGVCVVIGCGPVGLCAISSAIEMFETVFATDLAVHRLEGAKAHGAIALPAGELEKAVLEATNGRGADAVCEVVGHTSAFDKAFELIRPFGVISSAGVHTHEIKLSGWNLFEKNPRFQFGMCSSHYYFPAALEILKKNRDLFAKFIEHKIHIDKAEEYYKLFEQNKIGKTVISFDKKAT